MRHKSEPPGNDKPATKCEGLACDVIGMERNSFFTGKYMTARDFNLERDYFLSRHHLHNRLLHGWGIVCGLKVEPHPNPQCQDRWIIVRSGIAIDCCGRELIFEKEDYLDVEEAEKKEAEKEKDKKVEEVKDSQQSQTHQGGNTQQATNSSDAKKFLVCLRYKEKGVEEVPVLYDEGKCDPTRLVPNHIREIACLELKAVDDELSRCWPHERKTDEGDPCVPCRDDCDEYKADTNCLTSTCPCGDCVPLALVWRDEKGKIQIDMKGRKQMYTPMTHIVYFNWPHGGEVTLEHLRKPKKEGGMGGQLEVHFDHKLGKCKKEDVEGTETVEVDDDEDGNEDKEGGNKNCKERVKTGLDEHTFVVQYKGTQRALEFVESEDGYPRVENGCQAVFAIDEDLLGSGQEESAGKSRRRSKDTLAGYTVFVTLKCDFILDCHGNPVDGDYLAARLPTGNGIAGGTFESWFRVVYGTEEEAE